MPDEDVAVNDETGTPEGEVVGTEADEQLARLKESIDVKVEDAGVLRKKLTISVPRETIDERMQDQFTELKSEAVVPGFRKGRAPLELIEKRFGGEVGDQVTAGLIGNSYMAAIEKEDLDALGEPDVLVRVTEDRPDESGRPKKVEVERLVNPEEAIQWITMPKEGPLSYVCEIDLRPKFELPSLEKIPVKKPALSISDEDVDKELKRFLTLRGRYEAVEEASKENDVLEGSVRCAVDDRAVIDEPDAMLAVRDQWYSSLELKGFGEAAKGKKAGDSVAIDVTIPDDHKEFELRGKAAKFEMQVRTVKRLQVPELDDAFAKEMGFDSKDELRGWMRDQLDGELSRVVQDGMRGQVSQFLIDNTEMELPEGISSRHANRIVANRYMEMLRQGLPQEEIAEKTDELRSSAAEEAKRDLKHLFIMTKVAEEKEVEVREEELNAAIASIAQRRNRRFDRVRDELVANRQLESLYIQLRDEKILDLLLEDAEVTEEPVESKDEKAE